MPVSFKSEMLLMSKKILHVTGAIVMKDACSFVKDAFDVTKIVPQKSKIDLTNYKPLEYQRSGRCSDRRIFPSSMKVETGKQGGTVRGLE